MGCEQSEHDGIYALQCENIKNNKLIKWPLGDVFSRYLVIFPATSLSVCQSGSQMVSLGVDMFCLFVCVCSIYKFCSIYIQTWICPFLFDLVNMSDYQVCRKTLKLYSNVVSKAVCSRNSHAQWMNASKVSINAVSLHRNNTEAFCFVLLCSFLYAA